MKKSTTTLVTFFVFLIIVTNQVNAQKTITCEEWKQIVGIGTCKYSDVRVSISELKDHNSIWCSSDSKEIENESYVNRTVDYKYNTSEEKCIFDAQINAYEKRTGKSVEEPKTPKQETKSAVQTIDDWIRENDLVSDPAQIEQMEREIRELYSKTPQITKEAIRKAQEEWQLTTELMRAAPKFKYVLEDEWPDIKSVPWDTESGAVIKSDSWQSIYIEELADRITRTVIFKQGEMEVKVINENPTENKLNVKVDDFFDIFVIQTHFRVKYDPDKKLGVVNVYEGEVEVKTKDGKTVRVRPNGDRPGVAVVTQRLSIAKLIAVSVVLAAIIGGIFFILRKRFSSKSNKKRN